jgi:hypothetical protein
VRAEAEARASEEVERRVPDLPEGIGLDGSVTPQGVANFLALPEARESEEIQAALNSFAAGDRVLIRAVTEASPYTEEARDAVGEIRAVETPEGGTFVVGGLSAG